MKVPGPVPVVLTISSTELGIAVRRQHTRTGLATL